MIKVYAPTEKEFMTNGLKVIQPHKAVVFCEDNGRFVLEIEDTIQNIDYYEQDNIILAPTPNGPQPFRISDVERTKATVSFTANHVYYDAQNYVINDAYIVDKNCNYALNYLNTHCDAQTPFTTASTNGTISTFRCVRKSLEEAIQTVIERWGGHLWRDKFRIEIRESIGQDKGVTISYGKNLIDISAEEDWSGVVTKIMGTTTYNQQVFKTDWITGETQYSIPYTKVIEFENQLNEENYKDENGNTDVAAYTSDLQEWLIQLTTAYLEENSVPKVNYTLSAHLDGIAGLGDIIRVKHPKCKVDLITNVISYGYDALREKYVSIEFGNFRKTITGLVTNFTRQIEENGKKVAEETISVVSKKIEDAASQIVGTLNGYNIYENNCFYAMDAPDKESATNVLIINKGGIAFSTSGIEGPFNGVMSIDGTLNFKNINVINLLASMIRCDNLKVGGADNQNGNIELQDAGGKTIAIQDKDGIRMFTNDGGVLKINPSEGVAFYDATDTKVWWADGDIFHTKKFVAQDEFTLDPIRIVPIYDKNGVRTGAGFVALI